MTYADDLVRHLVRCPGQELPNRLRKWAARRTILDFSGTQVADVSPLAGLGALWRLNLYRTQVSDVSPLVSLPSLTWVTLPNGTRWNPKDGSLSPLSEPVAGEREEEESVRSSTIPPLMDEQTPSVPITLDLVAALCRLEATVADVAQSLTVRSDERAEFMDGLMTAPQAAKALGYASGQGVRRIAERLRARGVMVGQPLDNGTWVFSPECLQLIERHAVKNKPKRGDHVHGSPTGDDGGEA